MHRILLFLLFTCSVIYAQIQNVELLANSVKKNQNLVIAKGDVLVFSETYLVTADKAFYNDKSGDLELFGNVNLIRGASEGVKSKYIKINLKSNLGDFKPFFTYEEQSQMWLECENAYSTDKHYVTKNAITSSCNVQNPDWKLGFESGKLDKKTRFLQLRDVTFYIRDIPVFYLPYFAISTDTTRKTGLLIPTIGYGTKNGLIYMQPFYIAEYNSWDLEIIPQIRTNRGVGVNSGFRFVDTSHSKGSFAFGGFKDKQSYRVKEGLKNDIHKGFEFKYENTRLLEKYLSKGIDDGLWIDLTYLNDIDYLNLKESKYVGYDSLITSKANYYITTNKNYGGVYAKYYIDTEKTENDTTLQELPTFQYHHYLDSIFLPNILYSFDAKYHNYTRGEGVTAQQFEANLPITFYTSFFDEFLHFSASENIYATHINYENSTNNSDTFSKNYHKLSLYSDLSKPYSNFYHIMQFRLDYIIPSWDNGDITEDFLKTDEDKKKINGSFSQYFYDNSGKKRIKHAISQAFNLDKDMYDYGDLEHEITYYFTNNIYAKNDIHYSFEKDRFSKIQSALHVDNDRYGGDLIHTYQHDNEDVKESFLTADFNIKYGNHYSYFGSLDYNFAQHYTNSWKLGLKMKKKCWEYTLIYREIVSPKLTSVGSDSVKKKGFYLAFELYPIGGTDYDFAKETSVSP